MPQFHVEDDLARLVERLASPKPFENITFNDALKRVLERLLGKEAKEALKVEEKADALVAELDAQPAEKQPQHSGKKAPSPSARDWADTVPELKDLKGLSTWKAICDHLKIKTAGDSARRKLKNWVKDNRPKWPDVPEIG